MYGFRRHARLYLNKSGMTFVEVIFTSAVSLIIIAVLFHFTFLLERTKYEHGTNLKLNNKARQLVEEMAVGLRRDVSGVTETNRRGILEAASATYTANQIVFTDTGGTTHTIRLNSGNIEYRRSTDPAGVWTTLYDPNGAAAFDATLYSTSLTFSQTNPRAITVDLVLGQKVKGRWHYGSVSTQLGYHNS